MGFIADGTLRRNVPKNLPKWIDGDQNEAEMAKLEANLKTQISTGLALDRGSAT
jgi:hypothetical protein